MRFRLALRVVEKIGGVVQEERNTRVVGEPTGEKRAEKDLVDIKSRLLRALPEEQGKDFKRAVRKADDDPKKLLAAAKAEVGKRRLVLARKLLVEARLDLTAPDRVKEEVAELLAKVEKRILYDLTPAQEKRLEDLTDHPAFHRLAVVPGSRFLYLGPEKGDKAARCRMIDDGFARGPCHDRPLCINRLTSEWLHCPVPE